MPVSLIPKRQNEAKVSRTLYGVSLPWEIQGYREDFERAESVGGIFDLSHWSVIEVEGMDALDFLQRMTTVDFKKRKPGDVKHGAILSGRGLVIALGMFQTGGNGFHFLLSPPQGEMARYHLEKFHFGESLSIRDVTAEWALLALWKGQVPELTLSNTMTIQQSVLNGLSFFTWKEDVRPDLVWVKIGKREKEALLNTLSSRGVSQLGLHLYEYFRIEAGIPCVGVELSDKDIILEAGFDRSVARDKGCYPGQEVVERIFTYGQVNRKLFQVRLTGGVDLPSLPCALVSGGEIAGTLVSCEKVPNNSCQAVGLAFLQKNFWHSMITLEPSSGDALQWKIEIPLDVE